MSEATTVKHHPDEATTASYVEGRLPESARERFESHLAVCDGCRRALVLLRGAPVVSRATEPVPRAFLERSRSGKQARSASDRRLRPTWLAAAASAVLACLIAWPVIHEAPDPRRAQPLMRDVRPPAPILAEPVPGTAVSRTDLVFRWSAVRGADRYRIRVWSVDREMIREIEVEGSRTETAWPPDAAALPSGEWLWRVSALAVGHVIAESHPAPFEVQE